MGPLRLWGLNTKQFSIEEDFDMSGNVFDYPNRGMLLACGGIWLNTLQCTGQSLTIKGYPAHSVMSAGVEKL